VCHDGSSMVMSLSSSAKHSKDSTIRSKSRVCLQRHTIQPLMAFAKAFNMTIRKLLKKFISKSQRDWDDKLGECLWDYHTTVRTLTKAIPFSLVYGCEIILPLEIQIPSLSIALTTKMKMRRSIDCDSRARSFGR